MKLATYESAAAERWGFLYEDPATGRAWLFNPQRLVEQVRKGINPTGPHWLNRPIFRQDWPDDLAGFLELEEQGMAQLHALHAHLDRAVRCGADAGLLLQAGDRLQDVRLLAPIPRPRICFGLVQNGPSFIRNNPMRSSANLFPQGHNRPQGAILGPDDIVVHGTNSSIWGFNVELGVVIGKRGRYIPAHHAMEHVAGFVPIIDVAGDGFFNTVNGEHHGWQAPAGADWFQEATLSWCGKMADTMAPMGPYLVTRDEIANVYDLLVCNRFNGELRDRSHTGCHLLGVERLIHWYSSFATLYPGDVLHLGTMGVDGLRGDRQTPCGPEDHIEVEIERLGRLRSRVAMMDVHDWRAADDLSRAMHPSPAARQLIAAGRDTLEPDDWHPNQARHFWTVYGNYTQVHPCEGLTVSSYPRILNGPASSLGIDGDDVEVPPRATALTIGIELAGVVKRLASRVEAHEAEQVMLGYTPMLSISDHSFADMVVEPATPQEASLPMVYGRWADGFNVVSPTLVQCGFKDLAGLSMRVTADDDSQATGSTDEYVLGFDRVLAFLTRYITLFPGDVITLGRIAQRIVIPAHVAVNRGVRVQAEIDGMPTVSLNFRRDDQRKETRIVKRSAVHADVGD